MARITARKARTLRALIAADRCLKRPGICHLWGTPQIEIAWPGDREVSRFTCTKCGDEDVVNGRGW